MTTDVRNYEKIAPWQMNENNRDENYYDENGNYLGYLVKKKVLKERKYSPFYNGYFPGTYNLEFSNGKKFENIVDWVYNSGRIGGTYGDLFYKEPEKISRVEQNNNIDNDYAGDVVTYKPPFVTKTQNTIKGGRSRKRSKHRKISKKRKHRRKTTHRR